MSHGSYMTQGVMTAQQDSMELVMSTNTALGWLANSTAQDKGWLQEAATDSATADRAPAPTGMLGFLGFLALAGVQQTVIPNLVPLMNSHIHVGTC